MPEAVAQSANRYVLHPSVLDAAVQATIGLSAEPGDGETAQRARLPFVLDRIDIFAGCPDRAIACVRGGAASGVAHTVDIDLCDESGNVFARMQGLSGRAADNPRKPATSAALLFRPVWDARELSPSMASAPGEAARQWIVLSDGFSGESDIQRRREVERQHETALSSAMPGVRCLRLGSDAVEPGEAPEYAAIRLLNVVQEILADRSSGHVLLQLVTAAQGEAPLSRGLGALLKSAEMESGKLRCQVIGVEPGETAITLAQKLRLNARWGNRGTIRYEEGRRQVEVLREIADDRKADTAA
jgi:hypothetical protein